MHVLLVNGDIPDLAKSGDVVQVDLGDDRSPELSASVGVAFKRALKIVNAAVLSDADRLAELVVGFATPSPDLMKERIERRKTINALTTETEWYSAAQLADAGIARDWKRRSRVFAVSISGKDYYPAYQFDDALQPRPVISRVLKAFGPQTDPWKVVAWFHYPNGWLVRGNDPERRPQAPKDFLDDEEAVVQAANKLGNTYVA